MTIANRRVKPQKVISAQSLGANYTSPSFYIFEEDFLDLMIVYSGTSPVGTMEIQTSANDSDYASMFFQVGAETTPRYQYTFGTDLSPILMNIETKGLVYIRFKFTFTSGSGSMDIWLAGKRRGSA